jgi:hypothetical protein
MLTNRLKNITIRSIQLNSFKIKYYYCVYFETYMSFYVLNLYVIFIFWNLYFISITRSKVFQLSASNSFRYLQTTVKFLYIFLFFWLNYCITVTVTVFHFPHAAPLPYTLTASSVKSSANKSFYI